MRRPVAPVETLVDAVDSRAMALVPGSTLGAHTVYPPTTTSGRTTPTAIVGEGSSSVPALTGATDQPDRQAAVITDRPTKVNMSSTGLSRDDCLGEGPRCSQRPT